jgi:hypothetical protein
MVKLSGKIMLRRNFSGRRNSRKGEFDLWVDVSYFGPRLVAFLPTAFPRTVNPGPHLMVLKYLRLLIY